MISDFLGVAIFFVVGSGFVLITLFISWLLRPSKKSPVKNSIYECGEPAFGSADLQFNVRYYLFALLFVIFDVEVLFIIPWAVAFKTLGMASYFQMMIFIVILLIGLAYAWKKDILKWY